MIMNDSELKPCPFCGAIPVLWCDITDWLGKPVYKPNANGYRPIVYALEAKHKEGCFIRTMNGTNYTGQMIANNWQCIIKAWNKRA